MKSTLSRAGIIALLLFSSFGVHGITIKIGTIAPERSPWGKALQELSRDWFAISKGKVELKLYAGGIAGNEDDMIRKVRMGILGGAALSNRGLKKIYADVYVLNIPFAIRSNEELLAVLNKLKPIFESGIEKNGFKVVIWSTSGWVNFFSTQPVHNPDDIRSRKISFVTGEPLLAQAWKESGFRVIPNDLKDLMMALQSGMVDAFYLPPMLAASGQYFAQAKHMCDLRVAPLVGAIVLSQRVWRQIPEELRPALMQRAHEMSDVLYEKTIKLEQEALNTMVEHGLNIYHVPADEFGQWEAASEKGMKVLIGKAFSEEIYERFKTILKEIRKKAHDG